MTALHREHLLPSRQPGFNPVTHLPSPRLSPSLEPWVHCTLKFNPKETPMPVLLKVWELGSEWERDSVNKNSPGCAEGKVQGQQGHGVGGSPYLQQ